MRLKNLLIFSLLALLGTSSLAFGQSAPKAVLMFDFQMSRFLESELATQMNLKEMIKTGPAGVDAAEVVRVYGMASAPASVQDMMKMQGGGGGPLPMEFAVRVQFTDAGVMKKAIEKMAKDSETVEINGKTFYRPKGDAPDNVCAGAADEKTMIFGTDVYVAMSDPKAAASDGLKASWKAVSAGDDAVRLAIDLDGAKELINEAVEMGKQGADPMVQGLLDLVPSMKDMRLTLDVTGANLFTFGSKCVDSEKADELKGALDGLFAIAKMGAGASIKQMKQNPEMADTAAVAEKLVKSLGAKVDGNDVNITIAKPKGFEAAISKAAAMLPMMMGGGGPPPGLGPQGGGGGF